MGLNGTLVEAEILTFKCPMCVFQRVPFRPTTVQMSNLALIETKRITVYMGRINSCVWFWGLFCYIVYKITRKTASRKIILVYNILIVSKTTHWLTNCWMYIPAYTCISRLLFSCTVKRAKNNRMKKKQIVLFRGIAIPSWNSDQKNHRAVLIRLAYLLIHTFVKVFKIVSWQFT